MQWEDSGTIIGTRRHGESGMIVTLMVRDKGRWLGLVRGGCLPKMAPTLQIGNQVQAVWRARLESHLGSYKIELEKPRAAALLHNRARLEVAQIICSHLNLLPERDPHPELCDAACKLFDVTDFHHMAVGLALFELHCLEELGFGLDLARCAGTGQTDHLIYVSPKSGRAVSAGAGEPYKDKLLRLPTFMRDFANYVARVPKNIETIPSQEVLSALSLTGFFLTRHVFESRQLNVPDARLSFLNHVRQNMHSTAD